MRQLVNKAQPHGARRMANPTRKCVPYFVHWFWGPSAKRIDHVIPAAFGHHVFASVAAKHCVVLEDGG
eukprot:6686136-Lingulodinium_polyedra.AAC.1